MKHGFAPEIVLNVNVPYLPFEKIKEYQITRTGLRSTGTNWFDARIHEADPIIGSGESSTGMKEDGTDYGALKDGCVSITPIQLDLTAYQMMRTLQSWQWS